MSPPPDIFFLKFSRGSNRKNKQSMPSTNELEAYQWSGKCGNSLVCDSSSSLFSLFSGYHASYLAIILSHLNVIFFTFIQKLPRYFWPWHYFLGVYLLTNVRMFVLLLSFSSYLYFITLSTFNLSTSDSRSRTERFFQTMPQTGVYGLNQVYNRGGVVTQFCFPCFS